MINNNYYGQSGARAQDDQHDTDPEATLKPTELF